MIQVRVLRDGREVTDVALADLGGGPGPAGDPGLGRRRLADPEELATLGEEFDIHEVALEDLEVGERQRPKIEQYDDQVVLVFYAALPRPTGGRPGWSRSTSSPGRTTCSPSTAAPRSTPGRWPAGSRPAPS